MKVKYIFYGLVVLAIAGKMFSCLPCLPKVALVGGPKGLGPPCSKKTVFFGGGRQGDSYIRPSPCERIS